MVVLWVASAVGLLVVAPLVIVLATAVIRPALECARYADDILEHGVGITSELDAVPKLVRMKELTGTARQGVSRYGAALQRLL